MFKGMEENVISPSVVAKAIFDAVMSAAKDTV
jgi:hypothetical protein